MGSIHSNQQLRNLRKSDKENDELKHLIISAILLLQFCILELSINVSTTLGVSSTSLLKDGYPPNPIEFTLVGYLKFILVHYARSDVKN